jgi:hypothetical protein
MLQRTDTMNVPFVVRSKNQYNSHGASFIRRCSTLSDTPSRISSLIHLHVVLSLLEFLLGDIFFLVLDLMQSVPEFKPRVSTGEFVYVYLYIRLSINDIIKVTSYKIRSFTFHGTLGFHTLNKLSCHITRPNITFLKSRTT